MTLLVTACTPPPDIRIHEQTDADSLLILVERLHAAYARCQSAKASNCRPDLAQVRDDANGRLKSLAVMSATSARLGTHFDIRLLVGTVGFCFVAVPLSGSGDALAVTDQTSGLKLMKRPIRQLPAGCQAFGPEIEAYSLLAGRG